MQVAILTPSDFPIWDKELARFNCQSAFLASKYHLAFEKNGNGLARAFIANDSRNYFFYPFLLRQIPPSTPGITKTPLWDIETLFGNTGPISTTTDPTFLEEVWLEFSKWCALNSVISEFIRFHPFLENHKLASSAHNVFEARKIVSVPLNVSEEELLVGYAPRQRRFLRQANEAGLVCDAIQPSAGLADFKRLYYLTMDRVGAPDFYRFDPSFFDNIATFFPENLKLFLVRKGEVSIAAGLFFLCGRLIHYYLAGSDFEFDKTRPNNLMLHSAAEWGRTRGFTDLDLGGGRTLSPDDSLLQFKLGFSKNVKPCFLGTRIHNKDAYDALCSAWLTTNQCEKRPAFFQLYRLKSTVITS